jgi:hypothetical protein
MNDEGVAFTALETLVMEVQNLAQDCKEAPLDQTKRTALMFAAGGITDRVRNIMAAYASAVDVKLDRHELTIANATEKVKALGDKLGKLAKETPHLAGIIFISAEVFLDGFPTLNMRQLNNDENLAPVKVLSALANLPS